MPRGRSAGDERRWVRDSAEYQELAEGVPRLSARADIAGRKVAERGLDGSAWVEFHT